MFELLIGLCVILVCLLYKYSSKPDKFPPGPPRIPIIGSFTLLPKEVRNGQKKFQTYMQEAYGPGNPSVVLSDFELIKDLYKR